MYLTKDKRLKNIKDYDTYRQIHENTFKILSQANGYQEIGRPKQIIDKDDYMEENLKKCLENNVKMIYDNKETKHTKDNLAFELLKRRNQGRDPYHDEMNPQLFKYINFIEFADEIQAKLSAVPLYKRQNTPMSNLRKPKTFENAKRKLNRIQKNLNASINDQDILNRSNLINIELNDFNNRRANSVVKRSSVKKKSMSFRRSISYRISDDFISDQLVEQSENQKYVQELVNLNFYDAYNKNFEQKQPQMQQQIIDNYCSTLQNSSLDFVLQSAKLRGIKSFDYSKYLTSFNENENKNVEKIQIGRKKAPLKKKLNETLDEYLQREIIEPMQRQKQHDDQLKKLTMVNMDTFCATPNIQDQIIEEKQKIKNFQIKEQKRAQTKMKHDQHKKDQHIRKELEKIDQKLYLFLQKKQEKERKDELLRKQIEEELKKVKEQKEQQEKLRILEEIRLLKEKQLDDDDDEFLQNQFIYQEQNKSNHNRQQVIKNEIQQNQKKNNQNILQNMFDSIDNKQKIQTLGKQYINKYQQQEMQNKKMYEEDFNFNKGLNRKGKESFIENLSQIKHEPNDSIDIQIQQNCIKRYQKRMKPLYYRLLH